MVMEEGENESVCGGEKGGNRRGADMDRAALAAMLEKVRAMKARPSVALPQASVYAVATRAMQRQRERETRGDPLDASSVDSGLELSAASVSSPESVLSDNTGRSAIDLLDGGRASISSGGAALAAEIVLTVFAALRRCRHASSASCVL